MASRLALSVLACAILCCLQPLAVAAPSLQEQFLTRCEREFARGVKFQILTRGYELNHSLSISELSRLRSNGSAGQGARQHVLGLTVVKSLSRIDALTLNLQNPQTNQECLSVKLDVTLEYTAPQVYIAKEIPPGTCSYQQILEHELRHVQAYLTHLPKVEAALRPLLNQRFGVAPIYGGVGQGKPQLREQLQQELNQYWIPLLGSEVEKVEAQQRVIDSPQEYERMGRACNGEVQKFLREFVR